MNADLFASGEAKKAPIVVQLDAYALPDDHAVWKCSPGKTYRFYGVVKDAEVVFPDVRGLGDYLDSGEEWDDAKVLRIIADDRWVRELESRARNNKPKAGSESINPTDRTHLTFLKRLFFEAKKGDFVVVPAEGYDKEILFGEFLTDPSELRVVEAKDGEYIGQYVGRPVLWRKRVVKRELPPELIDELHYRAAVFVLTRSRAEDVYREVLGNFVIRGRYVAEFSTEKQKFTPEDFAVVSMWLNGLDFLRHEMATTANPTLPASFALMGLERVPDDGATELRIDIQSPGEIFARTVGPFALVLMSAMALSGCDAAAVVNNGVTIEMNSIGDNPPDCRLQVEEAVNSMVRTMSYKRLDEANCLSERAKEDTGIKTGARLKNVPKQGT
jgi:hypothetical protein